MIERDPKTGEPTGVLYENAYDLIAKVLPPVPLQALKDSMLKSIKMFLSWGITTITEIEATKEIIQAYQELRKENRLSIRVLLFVSATLMENLINLGISTGFGDEWLKILGVKFYADGSAIGGTAAVYTPQHRGPKGLGIIATPKEQLTNMVAKCHNAGLRVAIHAIGDRGIDIALDAIEEAQRQKPSDLRHRIEHCSCCTPKQQERIKFLKVVPSSSIGYMWEFGDSYIENFGPERIMWIHPHKSYIEKGIVASGNSDWACSPADPMKQIYCAVARKTKTGRVFCDDQAIPVLEAVRTYTINAAYASGEEDIKGTIEPGKLADMVVLSEDIFDVPYEKLKEVTVEMTIIGGKIVYKKGPK
jgi:predicted amidohydrolase YtcJ